MIDRGAGEPLIAERIQHRGLVDATTADDIDQVAGRLHRGERGGVDDAPGGRRERAAEGDEVRAGEHVGQPVGRQHLVGRAVLPRGVALQSDDSHAARLRDPG
jgi:hypothetical protein